MFPLDDSGEHIASLYERSEKEIIRMTGEADKSSDIRRFRRTIRMAGLYLKSLYNLYTSQLFHIYFKEKNYFRKF